MADAKQQKTQSLSWFRSRGRTSSSGVLKALYCSAPGVPVVGLLQARRERKRGSQVPGVMAEGVVGELDSKCVVQPVSCCILLGSVVHVSSVPCARGVRPPFIDHGKSESHARRAIWLREGA
jgi:hypothetical protein